jgi:hypothetical protein
MTLFGGDLPTLVFWPLFLLQHHNNLTEMSKSQRDNRIKINLYMWKKKMLVFLKTLKFP